MSLLMLFARAVGALRRGVAVTLSVSLITEVTTSVESLVDVALGIDTVEGP